MSRSTAPTQSGWRIDSYGDAAIELRCADEIGDAPSARVHAALGALLAAALPEVEDLVPGYVGLTVLLRDLPRPERDRVTLAVKHIVAAAVVSSDAALHRSVLIPACYGGSSGPDLAAVAAHTGLSEAEVIARHAAPVYRVAFIGFLPGFPYLIGLDPMLAMARRATPRTRVPAGSVAIGGAQTGIYPVSSPGGWHLLARTAVRLFDPQHAAPSVLCAGDRLRFRPVSLAELAHATVEIEHA